MSARIAVTPRSLSVAGHPALSLLTSCSYEIVHPAPGRRPPAQRAFCGWFLAAWAGRWGGTELAHGPFGCQRAAGDKPQRKRRGQWWVRYRPSGRFV